MSSLSIASHGLLNSGTRRTLHIASRGFLRLISAIPTNFANVGESQNSVFVPVTVNNSNQLLSKNISVSILSDNLCDLVGSKNSTDVDGSENLSVVTNSDNTSDPIGSKNSTSTDNSENKV